MKRRLWARLVLAGAAFGVIGAMLVACGNGGNGPYQPARTLSPRLAADAPPCDPVDWVPYHDLRTTCAELVLDAVPPPEAAPAQTGLAFAPDGTLYIARTATGDIWAMRDADGDGFLEPPQPVATGLTLPTRLAYHDGALYVASVAGVARLDLDADGMPGDPALVVDDLPGDSKFWPSGIGISPDGRLYVSVGANCTTCDGVTPRSGLLLSYTLDGDDRRIEATGFQYPVDFDWDPATGVLWVVDRGRVLPDSASRPPDELNRVLAGADYGFPACDNAAPDTDCAGVESPVVTFSHQSGPAGIAFYRHDAFPFWAGDLVIAFSGSWTLPEPNGYVVGVVGMADGTWDGALDRVAPVSSFRTARQNISAMSLAGEGFFPYRPVDVAISPAGWIYVGTQEGRIFRFRPRPAG